MCTFLNKTINELNLEFTPHTKALLEIYAEASDNELVLTNRYLKSELIRLLQTSSLVQLIFSEYMKSSDYDGRTEVSLENVNLNYTPHTKHLLKQYLLNQFEGTIEPNPETLKEVLLNLHKNDRRENDSSEKDNLGSLVAGEWIYSPGGLEPGAKLHIDPKKEEINLLKMHLNKELETLDKFQAFRNRCIMTNQNEFLKSCKKYKYLNFNEEQNEVTFSNEPTSPINITSAVKPRETYWKLSEVIESQEKKIGKLINQVLEEYGIDLPPNFGFTTYED